MNTSTWIAAVLTLAALLMGTTFAHVLEMPAKFKADSQHWVSYQNTLYRAFASVGGVLEIAAILGAAGLAWMLRGSGLAFLLAFFAALMLAIAFFGVWIFVTNPVNRRVAAWSEADAPQDWQHWRTQWEFSHAARFAMHLLAFVAMLFALLI